MLTKIQAVIRESQFQAVVERLVMIGVRGLTVCGAKGAGAAERRTGVFRGLAYKVPFSAQIVLEWVGPEDEAESVARAIQLRARTGAVGDGRIFIQRIEEAVRIRTGERGPDAV